MKKRKKYEFTGETIEFEGRTLKRIVYLKDCGSTIKGDIGGWIESESNLYKFLFKRVIVV